MSNSLPTSAGQGGQGGHASLPASAWVTRWLAALRPGARVLDFACGSGRHALWAAARGLDVLAVDRDAAALGGLAQAGLRTVVIDLEAAPWPDWQCGFDAVVCTNYLFRPRLDLLAGCLDAAGLLVYETFARGNERFGRPANPSFLLAPGELLALASRARLHVVAYEDGLVARPRPAMVQRLCARGPGLDATQVPIPEPAGTSTPLAVDGAPMLD